MSKNKRVSLKDLRLAREQGRVFACLTAYDATLARLVEAAGVDVILVGDSLSMVMQGHETTLPATVEDLRYHCACVVRTTTRAMIMVDMPFLSDLSVEDGLRNAGYLIQAGAQMIKLEAGMRQVELVRQLSECGIAVCVHLGLRPQQVHKLGSYAPQHTSADSIDRLKQEMEALVNAGADLLLFECVPANLAAEITLHSEVPVIGIGAGRACDGQVLVTHDVLGMTESLPFFAQNFLTGEYAHSKEGMIQAALRAYVDAVQQRSFPADKHYR